MKRRQKIIIPPPLAPEVEAEIRAQIHREVEARLAASGETFLSRGGVRSPNWLERAKDRTRSASYTMAETGVLIRTDCEDCGLPLSSMKIEAHHPDYTDARNVKWLCTRCHAKEHAAIRRGEKPPLVLPTKAAVDAYEAQRILGLPPSP